jgi:hypothetical protein
MHEAIAGISKMVQWLRAIQILKTMKKTNRKCTRMDANKIISGINMGFKDTFE